MPSSFLNVCRFNPTLGGTTDWTYSSAVTGYQSPAAAGAVNGAVYSYRAESANLAEWEIGFGAYSSGTGVFARTTVLFNSLGTTAKINFSAAPQVAIVALAEDLLSFNSAMSLTPLQKEQGRSNLGVLATRYWSGGQHSNNVASPNTKIDIAAGVWRNSTDVFNIVGAGVTLDTAVIGANGLDATGTWTSARGYTFAISKVDGTFASLASLSPTAPTLPSGYVYFRRIGMFKTDVSGNILAFTHVNDTWYYSTAIRDITSNVLTAGTVTAKVLASVPFVQGVTAIFAPTIIPASGTSIVFDVMPGFLPSTATAGWRQDFEGLTAIQFLLRIPVDSSGQIKYRANAVNHTVTVDVAGWIDPL